MIKQHWQCDNNHRSIIVDFAHVWHARRLVVIAKPRNEIRHSSGKSLRPSVQGVGFFADLNIGHVVGYASKLRDERPSGGADCGNECFNARTSPYVGEKRPTPFQPLDYVLINCRHAAEDGGYRNGCGRGRECLRLVFIIPDCWTRWVADLSQRLIYPGVSEARARNRLVNGD